MPRSDGTIRGISVSRTWPGHKDWESSEDEHEIERENETALLQLEWEREQRLENDL